jgi:hypothetical protein
MEVIRPFADPPPVLTVAPPFPSLAALVGSCRRLQ